MEQLMGGCLLVPPPCSQAHVRSMQPPCPQTHGREQCNGGDMTRRHDKTSGTKQRKKPKKKQPFAPLASWVEDLIHFWLCSRLEPATLLLVGYEGASRVLETLVESGLKGTQKALRTSRNSLS
jgi:hypothetical protein